MCTAADVSQLRESGTLRAARAPSPATDTQGVAARPQHARCYMRGVIARVKHVAWHWRCTSSLALGEWSR